MASKPQRHSIILRLLDAHDVTSQEMLRELLAEEGLSVAQGTLSRDIRELGLAKIPNATGTPVYSAPPDVTDPTPSLSRLLRPLFIGADGVGNLPRLLQRGSAVVVHVEAKGLEPGLHGVHVHETGRCDARGGFESAGGHLNPQNVTHGLQSAAGGHAGDLPNLEVDQDSTGSLRFEATELAVDARAGAVFDRDGSAIVIHARPDDQTTDPSGNSGDRVVCGVFERG